MFQSREFVFTAMFVMLRDMGLAYTRVMRGAMMRDLKRIVNAMFSAHWTFVHSSHSVFAKRRKYALSIYCLIMDGRSLGKKNNGIS